MTTLKQMQSCVDCLLSQLRSHTGIIPTKEDISGFEVSENRGVIHLCGFAGNDWVSISINAERRSIGDFYVAGRRYF